jgi:hypothetical protein
VKHAYLRDDFIDGLVSSNAALVALRDHQDQVPVPFIQGAIQTNLRIIMHKHEKNLELKNSLIFLNLRWLHINRTITFENLCNNEE